MVILRYFVLVTVFIKSVLTISRNIQNDTAEILWKLSNFALESRQNYAKYPYPYSYKYPGKYPEYYQNYPINSLTQYPLYQNKPYQYHEKLPYFPKPSLPFFQQPFNPNFETHKESFMDALDSVARNDDLRCVPKVICEVTAGTISGRQQGLNLPININMESLLGFLSVINGVQSNPLLYFAKAALLGYTSKGNSGPCSYAYPKCPSDPEKLVLYLNNHNGGFFRFFNGISHSKNNYRPYLQQKVGEERIQNKPAEYSSSYDVKFPNDESELIPNFEFNNYRQQKGLKFPTQEIFNDKGQNDGFFLRRPKGSLKFPTEEIYRDYDEQPYRKPKELPYDINFYQSNNELDLQRPLPNHHASPIIFPIRTGTGELILDNEEFDDKNFSYQNDDVRLTFNGFHNFVKNEQTYKNNVPPDLNLHRNGRGISFPSV